MILPENQFPLFGIMRRRADHSGEARPNQRLPGDINPMILRLFPRSGLTRR